MKTLQMDVLLYHPTRQQEMRIELRVPIDNYAARRLLDAQDNGVTIYEQNALYKLASALGELNGLRGMPLRVREVRG